jgi:hypothetical protein
MIERDGKQYTTPFDYAEWGAAAGVAIAKTVLAHPFAPAATKAERDEAINAGFANVREAAKGLREIGVSGDEVRIYEQTARGAFDAQMLQPHAKHDRARNAGDPDP